MQRYIEKVDKVIFLGDYLDPYPRKDRDYTFEWLLDNLMNIIDLKHSHMKKVVLLKGNHDQHYSSEEFCDLACGSRCDIDNWNAYHDVFNRYKDLFKLAHQETVNGIPYVFSHAGMTDYWIGRVNSTLWKLADDEISLADPEIIDRINALDGSTQGQEMLAVVGSCRSYFGEKTGSMLWADVGEHAIPDAPMVYGLNEVFQVFGHTRLYEDGIDRVEYENFVMIDSQQCFMIDEGINEKITELK